jgi:surface antigen
MATQFKLLTHAAASISSLALLVLVGISATKAQAVETFSVDSTNGGLALNTNNQFRKIDGQPRMAVWQRNDSDPDQQFGRLPGKKPGSTLLKHIATSRDAKLRNKNAPDKCLNAHYLGNGKEINVWDCKASDPAQNFDIIPLGNSYYQIRRTGTKFCVDSPTRTKGGKVHLWECNASHPNQRWKTSQTQGVNQKAEGFFLWANGQSRITRLDTRSYVGQCVTLIARYLQEVYLNGDKTYRSYGNGKDVAKTVAANFRNSFEPLTKIGLPKRGAIISFLGPSAYGHVGIVMEARTSGNVRQVRMMESNWDNKAPNTTVRIGGWISIDGNTGWTNPR